MAAMQAEHPQVQLLSAFALGKLETAALDAIESHLAECPSCCDTLNQIKEDTFVGLVRMAKEDGHDAREAPADTDPDTPQLVNAEVGSLAQSLQARKDVMNDMAGALAEAGTVAQSSPAPGQPATEPAAAVPVAELPIELANHAKFRVVDLLGTGGMGAVYKAEHRMMKRTVALKVINPKFMQSKQAVERFHREVQAAARLHHPNIVTAHDAEQAGGAHYLVMEYVPGTDLQKVLEQRGPLPIAEACEYIRQAALGLQHAHENGMVHRDIKPQNLMLSGVDEAARFVVSSGRSEPLRLRAASVKILDFGLASLTEAAVADEDTSQPSTADLQKSGLTQAGALMGTPDYMAPEQAKDARTADIRSDIYSLGCTLYALLSGKVPFPGGTAIDKVIAHSTNQPRPIKEFRADVPAALVKVLQKMMAKDPAQRYQTPSDVANAVAPFVRIATADAPAGSTAQRRVEAAGDVLIGVGSMALACTLGIFGLLAVAEGFGQDTRWTLQMMGLSHGVYAGCLIAAGMMVRRLHWRLPALAAIATVGIVIPCMIANNVIMEWGRVPLWPVLIPQWLGLPFCLWTISVLFRTDVRDAFRANAAARDSGLRRPIAAVAIAGVASVLLLAGIVFYWQTPDGWVRFEINDPQIKVAIDNDGPRITGADKEAITLKPGHHGMMITRGDLMFHTQGFELRRGATTRLKIDWLPDQKVVIRQDGRETKTSWGGPIRPDFEAHKAARIEAAVKAAREWLKIVDG